MTGIPKIVLQGLAKPASEAHPDADLLTAFVERSLPESERAALLGHLSRCGDCREVVALALPAIEDAAKASPIPARVGWLTLPVLRWGVVAAGILAVTSVALLQYEHHYQEKEKQLVSTLAPIDTLRQPTAQTSEQHPATSSAASRIENTDAKNIAKKREAPAEKENPADKREIQTQALASSAQAIPSPGASAGAGLGSAGGIAGGVYASPSASAPAKPPATTTRIQVQAAVPMMNTESADTSGQLAQSQTQQLRLNDRNVADLAVVGKAKNPVTGQPSPGPAAIQSPSIPLQTSPSLMLHAAPRWAITATGGLQRSFDAGRTWEDVNVNSASVAAVTAMNLTAEKANAKERAVVRGYSTDSSIAGSVTDVSGAAVADASVTLTNLDTAGQRTQSSSSDGLFTFANLSPGHYQIDVQKSGFKHLSQTPITVDVRQNTRLAAALQVGEASEVVEVTAAQAEASSGNNAESAKKIQSKPGRLEAERLNQEKKEQEKKENQEKPNWLSLPNPVFRALAASGSEVWAGASGAMLYHSLDAGAHWTRVLPSSAGVALTGDITAVEFSDLEHGRITTSTPEIWSTTDDGQTWQKIP